jgi:cytochrome o ubiquinol oxidase subunit 1
MMVRGFVDAAMMRTQQALASGDSTGYLIPAFFNTWVIPPKNNSI